MQASIEVSGLRKRFGSAMALDGLSFTVQPGQVTGFVGPNGAGKSTTMRVILGLDALDEGTALVGGRPYRSLRRPLQHVGALLDAGALQASRTGRNHLLWLAHSQGLTGRRVDQVLDQVGLQSAPSVGRAAIRWACDSDWGSPPRCSATRRRSSSTNRSTGWTRRASSGSAHCCARWPTKAARSWCPAT